MPADEGIAVTRSPDRELRRLVDLYARTMDDRDSRALIELFVPGGRLTIRSEQTREFVAPDGLEQIIAYMGRYTKTFYFVGNHICNIDGNEASGETYSIAYHQRARPGRPTEIVETPIRYRDTYVHTPNGWRFEHRVAAILWTETRELPR